jgi:mannonate dehydratase
MIGIAEVLGPKPDPVWALVRQCGVTQVVGAIDLRPRGEDLRSDDQPWSLASLRRVQAAYAAGGFSLDVIESRPPLELAKAGLPGRDREIEAVCELVRNLGRLGIRVWCYEWMLKLGVIRTATAIPGRGGALVTGFSLADLPDRSPTEYGDVPAERLWDSLRYFLERVVPVAEEADVVLAMHPDDPPLSPIRGVARIMSSVEGFQGLIDLVPSPANGITLCQGNFTLMTDDLPGVIRQFGRQGRIGFVHFRDVRGTPERFQETFHDEGKTDMVACMEAYRDVGFDGVCRPDHVPTMAGDTHDRPMYSSIGRLFAIGYLKGLREAVYRQREESTL